MNYFIRQPNTDLYAKFRPSDSAKPFGIGTYVLAKGLTGAAVFDALHARQFIGGLKDVDLEMVDVEKVLRQEAAKKKDA